MFPAIRLMRRGRRNVLLILLIAALSLMLLPIVSASARGGNAFQGPWIGHDPAPPVGDGSTNSFRVGGGNNHVRYQEDLLSACDQFTGSPLRGYFMGFADIENGTLTVETTLYCVVPGLGVVPTEKFPQPFTAVFVDEGDGTISSDGVCYYRPGRAADCEPDPVLSPVDWTIDLDDWGPGVHTIFTIADVRPMTSGAVEDLSGRLVWNETVVDLCGIEIRNIGDGYIHIGDGYQTTEGCGSDPAAMQDAFDAYGVPETACVAVTSEGQTYEYCAPLEEI